MPRTVQINFRTPVRFLDDFRAAIEELRRAGLEIKDGEVHQAMLLAFIEADPAERIDWIEKLRSLDLRRARAQLESSDQISPSAGGAGTEATSGRTPADDSRDRAAGKALAREALRRAEQRVPRTAPPAKRSAAKKGKRRHA